MATNLTPTEQAIRETAVPPLGCRTLCQHPRCGQPIELVPPTFPGGDPFWSHVDGWYGGLPPGGMVWHRATPVEQPEPSPGERLVSSVETSVAAYQRGRSEALAGFAEQLRELAGRPGNQRNQRLADSLLAVAEVADRAADGTQPGTYCPFCKESTDNHYPCCELDCPCWCQDPDTPADMLRPPRYGGGVVMSITQSAWRASYLLLTADRCDWCGPTHERVRPVQRTALRCCDDCWAAGAWVRCDPARPVRSRRQVCRTAGCADPTHSTATGGPDAGRVLSPEDRAECAEEAAWKRHADH